ncbi:MAG TPA: TrmJ/YjtD family RNA methyltransferase [Blastocatellia bacterium]|nr:TrmJ/YjtD family RNA methyltransferase [Blastocatellia bacterium]
MLTASCKIVLVRPRNPNNIGAAARAMKNFGLADLWVVAPYRPVWEEVVSAVNAAEILAGAHLVDTLDEAIADRNLVVGTADRTRVEENRMLYTPADLIGELGRQEYRPALVFGSEKHGLTNEDLARCHRVLSIPTRPDCPSINLGQAVAICCYELVRAEVPASASLPGGEAAATAGVLDSALRLALEVLREIDFVLPGNEPELTRRIRSRLWGLNLTEHDAGMLCGILSRINRELAKKEVAKIDNE